MRDPTNVVPSAPTVTEEDWVTSIIAGMGRAQRRLGGQKALAYTMDRTAKQLGNIMSGASGAFESAKPLFDAYLVEGTILDEIADLYGLTITRKGMSVRDEKPLSVLTCSLLKKAIDAELDGSEDHAELLDMENELRAVRAAVDQRLERVARLRAPKSAPRAVA